MPLPTPVVPKLGRYGSMGLGLQTAVGIAAVPDMFLRDNGGSSVTASVTRTRDNYRNGSIDQLPERTQGRTIQGKNITGEVDHASMVYLLQLITGGLLTTGTITPSQLNWDEDMPLQPVTIEANIPGSPTRILDAQFNNLSITMNSRANATYTAAYMATRAEDMPTGAAPAVFPLSTVYQYRDHSMKFGGAVVKPEASSLTLDVPLQAIDGMQGDLPNASDFVTGFERNGARVLSGSFTLAGVKPELLAAYRNGSTATLEWALTKWTTGGTPTKSKEIRIVVPNAEINMFDPPNTLDRIATPANWTAVSLAGELPFTITVL